MNIEKTNYQNNLLGSSFIEIKKSKFYTYMYRISSKEEAINIINNIKENHKKAKHILYLYKTENTLKIHNDGEPQGTGLNTCLNILEKDNAANYLVISIRYYGGILLGSGPLMRNYLNGFLKAYKNVD